MLPKEVDDEEESPNEDEDMMPDVKVAESNNEFNEVVPEGEEDQEKQGGGSG